MAIAVKREGLSLVGPDGELIADPLQGTWTEDQYLKITDGINWRLEFNDGFIEVLPVTTDRHQMILFYHAMLLHAFLLPNGGVVLPAPLRVRTGPRKFREPDIVAFVDANDPRRSSRYWRGADLVVEVVSPDDPQRDLVVKREEYAAAGIREYWIVNPLDDTITVLTLDGEQYAEHGIFRRGDTATSVVLAGFSVAVNTILDAGPPLPPEL